MGRFANEVPQGYPRRRSGDFPEGDSKSADQGASDRFEESVLLPLQVRLARRLCAVATDFGSEVFISQEQLGIYVGAARATA
jgi:hypothetical protein